MEMQDSLRLLCMDEVRTELAMDPMMAAWDSENEGELRRRQRQQDRSCKSAIDEERRMSSQRDLQLVARSDGIRGCDVSAGKVAAGRFPCPRTRRIKLVTRQLFALHKLPPSTSHQSPSTACIQRRSHNLVAEPLDRPSLYHQLL